MRCIHINFHPFGCDMRAHIRIHTAHIQKPFRKWIYCIGPVLCAHTLFTPHDCVAAWNETKISKTIKIYHDEFIYSLSMNAPLKNKMGIDFDRFDSMRAHRNTMHASETNENTRQFGITSENHCIVSKTNDFFFLFVVVHVSLSLSRARGHAVLLTLTGFTSHSTI